MTTDTLLQQLAARGLRLWLEGEKLMVAPKEVITEETRALIRQHKSELVQALASDASPDPDAEHRRLRLHELLDAAPDAQYAVIVQDASTDPVIVAIAVRGKCACELHVPHDKYDGVLLMSLLEKHVSTTH